MRLGDGRKPATVNRELTALKRMFTLAMKAGKLASRPHIASLAEDNAREGFLEPADFASVREHLHTDVADAATFAYLTGWRKGEATTLEWRDVNLAAREIRLRSENSKNKRPRVVKLAGELLALLEHRASVRQLDCPLVFHRAGKPLGDFRKAWATACEAAGFAGILFHDLRRSAVRNMVRAGVPERVAMRISGHRTRSIFDRYDVTSETDLDAAAERTALYVEQRREEGSKVATLASYRRTAAEGEGGQKTDSEAANGQGVRGPQAVSA